MSTTDDLRSGESSAPMPAPFIDLANQRDLTFALLDDTKAWRERAIYEIVLRDSDHVDVSTAYQLHLPVDLIRRYEPTVKPGDRVRLLLPFTIRPKQLLLNVNFSGVKGESCALLPRAKDSELQAAYLAHLDSRGSRRTTPARQSLARHFGLHRATLAESSKRRQATTLASFVARF